jgi:hypothetical protein
MASSDADRFPSPRTCAAPGAFPRLIYTVFPADRQIRPALTPFHASIDAIERERQFTYAAQWPAPSVVDEPTCVACGLRFRCGGYPRGAARGG